MQQTTKKTLQIKNQFKSTILIIKMAATDQWIY